MNTTHLPDVDLATLKAGRKPASSRRLDTSKKPNYAARNTKPLNSQQSASSCPISRATCSTIQFEGRRKVQ